MALLMTQFSFSVFFSRIVAYAVVFTVVDVTYRYAATGTASIESAAFSLVAGISCSYPWSCLFTSPLQDFSAFRNCMAQSIHYTDIQQPPRSDLLHDTHIDSIRLLEWSAHRVTANSG